MKIKVSILLLTGLLLSFNSFSQLKFGITTGAILASTNISSSSTDLNNHFIITPSSDKVGYQGGIKAQLFIGDLFFQSEILLSSLSSKMLVSDGALQQNYTGLITQTNIWYYQKYTDLSLPVLIGYKIGMIHIDAGPVVTYIINNNPSGPLNFSSPNTPENIKFHYFNTLLDYQIGIGVDIWKLSFDLKFQGNITKLGDGMRIDGRPYTYNTRVNQWIFGIGYNF